MIYFARILIIKRLITSSPLILNSGCFGLFSGSQHLYVNVSDALCMYEGRSIYKEPVAAVFLIFEILKIQDTRFVENSISNIFG